MVGPDALEVVRSSGVDAQATSDVWRGVKPVGVFANALTQRQKDYPDHLGEQTTKTVTTSTDLETGRQNVVDKQAASDVWRGVKIVGVHNGALAQDSKDYPAYVDEYHTKTMVNPDILEASR